MTAKGGISMRDHRKLRAFQAADELALITYELTNEFPRHEQFGLTSQMRRAAVSIASNIVEGSARRTEADYLRFLDMSGASARELEYQFSLARRLGYVKVELEARAAALAGDVNRLITALINALKKSPTSH
jgi:four helix bundle protein